MLSLPEPSTRLSLERAREYDRISEILAASNVSAQLDDLAEDGTPVEFGIEGRRTQFDKNSYRQPVLTQEPMLPRPYRWGQPDPMAEECRERLLSLQDYALMNEKTENGSEEETVVQSSTLA